MNAKTTPPPESANEEISALIETLHRTERRLEKLTVGEVDTVADREGRTFLLRRAQDHLRHSEAAKQAAILNALPAHIALLDTLGRIISVNEAWRRFASANVLQNPEYGIGINYLAICDGARGDDASEARQAAAGIRSVLAGSANSFSLEYPCHSPAEERWFLMTVTPLADDRLNGAVVMHVNITERKRSEEALLRFGAAMDATVDAIYLVDRSSMSFVHVNDAACRMRNQTREELLALGPDGVLETSRAELERTYDALIASGVDAKPLELLRRRKDGSEAWLELRRHATRSRGGWMIVTLVRDITERKRASQMFKDLLESAPDAMVIVNRESELVLVNARAVDLFGWRREELLGQKIDLLVPERFRGKLSANRSGFLAQPRAREMDAGLELFGLRKDGTEFPVDVSLSPLETDEGLLVISAIRDITERKLAEKARQLHAAELEESQRIARIGSWEWSIATGVVTWSEGMNQVLARDRGSPSPTFEALPQFFTPDSWQRLSAVIARAVETWAPYDLELEMIRVDGATCWTTTRGEAVRGADGTVAKLRGTVHDITDRKKADERIAYLNRVYAVLSDINTLIVRVHDRNELFKEACRIAVEKGGFRMALIGIVDPTTMQIVPVASKGVDEELLTAIKSFLSSREGTPEGSNMVARSVREKTVIVSNKLQSDSTVVFRKQYAESGIHSAAFLPLIVANEAVGMLALYAGEFEFFQDEELKLLTELAGDIAFAIDHIEKRERLDYLAYYDVLTGLANRSLFLERLAQYKRSAVSGGHKLALYLIDLERFKNINYSLGRPAGDTLLRQVAEWLTRSVGDAGLLARVGADVFAAVLPQVRQDGDLARFLEKKMDAFLEHPFRLNDAVFRIAVKVGVVVFPDDGADAETLFRNAEVALKKAKASGQRYLFYTQTMTEAVAGKLSLENQLRQAIDNEEFVLHYQPKVNLASGKLTSAEALIRWNDPRTGLVLPGRFIPVLEETGLIYEVGRWALKKAIADYLRWFGAGLPAVRIAVNVSALQLRNRGFIEEIRQAIGIDAHAAAGLELEITESLIMEDVKGTIASLGAIRAMGVPIAIDDFGTGFSSLSYLAKLPVDTLKIDRSFVVEMTVGPEGLALVSTVIKLAHSLKLKVVAEGVETEEQARLLRLLACDEMQGYLFSKPVPAEIFETRFLALPPAE